MTPAARAAAPRWRCPKCGRGFANRNQSYACERPDLADHFRLTSPDQIDEDFKQWLLEARAVGEQKHLRRNRD